MEGKDLISAIHLVAASVGAACTRTEGPSPVLKAIGLTDDQAYASVRFSVGRFTTEAEIDGAVDIVEHAVRRLRQMFQIPSPSRILQVEPHEVVTPRRRTGTARCSMEG